MLEENKEADSNIMTWIGLLLLCLIVAFYLYYNPSLKGKGELQTVEGRLSATPEYVDMGVNPDHILIQLIKDRRKYHIGGCGLRVINREILYSLNTNDQIRLVVGKENYTKEISFFNGTVSVLEVELADNTKILTLSQTNNCEKVVWKRILWLTPFLGIALILSVIKIVRKNANRR